MYRRMTDDYYDEMIHPAQMMPRGDVMEPTPPTTQPISPVMQGTGYSQGWLIKQIGKYIKVEFLIGTSMLIDREGILTEVGINYIVLKESGTKDDLMCDMYSIKFVRVFDDQNKAIICK
ncbi:MAG: hypothetical protein N4A50_03580 [Vallitalea sp.]|jgi:hypothetical protein|nr:hypothetical protein [Vallitalea sp.]